MENHEKVVLEYEEGNPETLTLKGEAEVCLWPEDAH